MNETSEKRIQGKLADDCSFEPHTCSFEQLLLTSTGLLAGRCSFEPLTSSPGPSGCYCSCCSFKAISCSACALFEHLTQNTTIEYHLFIIPHKHLCLSVFINMPITHALIIHLTHHHKHSHSKPLLNSPTLTHS